MSEVNDRSLNESDRRQCPTCKCVILAPVNRCSVCGSPITPTAEGPPLVTRALDHKPLTLESDQMQNNQLPAHASVILQFLPSGTCMALALKQPVILGRGTATDLDQVLDLSGFNAIRHGVSRKHCRLERHETQLFVTDLDSSNGTYLNHEMLLPRQKYSIADGDQLVLGTLHIIIAFSSSEPHL